MGKNIALTLAVLLLSLAAVEPSPAQFTRPHCHCCGRFIDVSPARMNVTVTYRDHDRGFETCSLFCLCELLEDCPDYTLKHVRIRDYTSAKDKEPRYLSAMKAVYLIGVEADEEKTSAPFIFAFIDENTAKLYQADLGGELLHWDEAFARCIEAAADYEPNQPQSVHPPKRR